MREIVTDPIKPFLFTSATKLILGSFPAPKARETGFYYAHPSNVFWKVLAKVFNVNPFKTNNEKKLFLIKNKISLWNTVHKCEIEGAKDSSIKVIEINDLVKKIKHTNINQIFVTGRLAEKLYNKYYFDNLKIKAQYLPSTSGSNRFNFSLEKLVESYQILI